MDFLNKMIGFNTKKKKNSMRQLKITQQITNRDSKSLEKYFQEISKIEMITAEEEVHLAIKIKEGDQVALNTLVNANLRFVVSVAKQYQNRGLRLSDLINEGNFGLVKAAKRFDETRGFKFISYAVWWIRQSILKAISEQSRVVRLPLNKIGTINKIYGVQSRLEQDHQRKPTSAEIAAELDMQEYKVKSSMKNSSKHLSMDAPLKDGESFNLHNVMQSKADNKPDKKVMQDSLSTQLNSALNTLPERERKVVRLYFGIGNASPMSLLQIAELFDITRERVRQMKEKGLRILRKESQNKVLRTYL